MHGAVLSWELLSPLCCPSCTRLNSPSVLCCSHRLGSPAATHRWWMWGVMTSCGSLNVLIDLNCLNQPHLGPTPTAPASGASFELGSLCFPELYWRCARPCCAGSLGGPQTHIAGPGCNSTSGWFSWMALGVTLQVAWPLTMSPGWTLDLRCR